MSWLNSGEKSSQTKTIKSTIMKKLKFTLAICLTALMGFTACNKDNRKANMNVKMTDDPGDFQEVNVEILRVEVNHETEGWIELETNSGMYNLLELQNGVTADLVVDQEFPEGEISQMRLILGSNNNVMVDSTTFILETPSAENTGLKMNVNHEFEANAEYEILFDFDAGKSIVIQGNGTYSLKPVLKVEAVTEL